MAFAGIFAYHWQFTKRLFLNFAICGNNRLTVKENKMIQNAIKIAIVPGEEKNVERVAIRLIQSLDIKHWKGDIEQVSLLGMFFNECGIKIGDYI